MVGMSDLKSRIKKALAALDKIVPVEPVKLFVRTELGVMGEEEKRFRKDNPNYRGKGLIITWLAPNAINYDKD
jgi:hypothetical protein